MAAWRALVSRRLGLAVPERLDRQLTLAFNAAMAQMGARAPDQLLAALSALPWTAPLWQAAIDLLTVRETTFFRQHSWWRSLITEALAPLIAERRRDGTRRLRCLSIGCASGEEPYSLAMTVAGLIGDEPGWQVEIVGADLCATALAEARAGLFDTRAIREVSETERAAWFRPAGRHRFVLDPRLREKVAFQLFNLAEAAEGQAAPGLGAPADLVLCRNVIIHMEPVRQPPIARFLGAQVRDGGMLAVAPVEATAAWFAPLRFNAAGHAILFSKDAPKPACAQAASLTPVAATKPAPPADATARLDRARQLADLGLFEEARQLCGEALATSPEADLLMALVCQALGDLPAAEDAARRSLRATPLAPAAHYVFAIICLRAGKTGEARQALREAVRLIQAATDDAPQGRHLKIDAGQIRQAARRLGVDPSMGGDGAELH